MDAPVVPFLRWLGGKRWLAPTLAPALRRVAGPEATYFEPFLGAGAMALALDPGRAVLSDANRDLIECFRHVIADPDGVLAVVAGWPVDAETYYAVRRSHDLTGISAAARFVYLNRCSYGGLHRTNKLGHFTASYGGGSRTAESLFRENLLANAAAILSKPEVRVVHRDYLAAFRDARPGDVVYCDPPYSLKSRGTFDRYGADVFSWADQERLADAAAAARGRGILVLVSNGSHPDIARLYSGAVEIAFWKRKRVGHRAADDATHDEIVYVLDPIEVREDMWLALQKSPGEAYGPRFAERVAAPA